MKHKKKNIKNRKYMKDDMGKRIKSNFYKQLKRKLNHKLREINIFNQNFAFSQSMIIPLSRIISILFFISHNFLIKYIFKLINLFNNIF